MRAVFTLCHLKKVHTTFLNKVGIGVALKSPLKSWHLSRRNLWRSDFASRIAHGKFVEPRWLGKFEHVPIALKAAGSRTWDWRMKAILPVVGLALFAHWCGSLIQEFSNLQPTSVRQPIPPAVADPETVLKGWVDVPSPTILIRPEVVHEPALVPVTPQPTVTPPPSVPKLMVTQIFAKLDRGEITVAETKVLLAARSAAYSSERSRK